MIMKLSKKCTPICVIRVKIKGVKGDLLWEAFDDIDVARNWADVYEREDNGIEWVGVDVVLLHE